MTRLPEECGEEPKLKAFLAQREVERVLFIDDGFEPLENAEPIDHEQAELWAAIEADAEALPAAMGEGLSGPDDLSGRQVADFLRRPEGDPLRKLAETAEYVLAHREKTAVLRRAIDYLTSLGIEVLTTGRDTWRDHVEGVSIVFLDWRLGSEADVASAIEQASRTAREIHQLEHKPFIVLVSSDPTVKDRAQDFSRHSGLMLGLFDAMPKEWLKDRPGVDLQMTVLGEHLQRGHAVQAFADAVSNRAVEAIQTFLGAIRGLTLSDYANLQHFALKREGHPLGDYLAELLAGVWADALFRGSLREQLRALDRQEFDRLPALAEPSEALADLYCSAVFDTHVGDFAPHPHRPVSEACNGMAAHSDASGEEKTRLSLSLGDVIIEPDGTTPSRAYVVLNPQCDLAESPRHGREIDDDLSILLLPGDLRSVSTPERTERKESADTPFFASDGARHRIRWEGKRLVAVPYGRFGKWLKDGERRRKARMRPTFALALQRAVTADLSRVGLPVPPPLHEPMEVSLHRARAGNWTGSPAIVTQGRFLMARDAKDDQIVLTHDFMVRVCGIVRDGLAEMRASSNMKDAENVRRVEAAMSDPAELGRLARPFALTEDGAKFLGGAVLVCRESKRPKSGFDRKHIVCISLPDA